MMYHLTRRNTWSEALAAGIYTADSLTTEGFIHCSSLHQVVRVANAYFPGQKDMLLLVIDEGRLQSPVRYEDLRGEGQVFPHIYGPLNLDAVTAVKDMLLGADGTLELPAGL